MLRVAIVIGLAVFGLALLSCGSSAAPQLPEIAAPSDRIVAGVVFDDLDGDGRPGSSDRALADLVVRLGASEPLRRAFPELATTTDEAGGFVLELPEGLDPDSTVVSVEIGEGSEAVQVWASAPGGTVDLAIAVSEPKRCEPSEAGAAGISGASCSVLLPDLIPIIDGVASAPDEPMPVDSAQVDTTMLPGRRFLRFASLTANVGPGPLHVVAVGEPNNGQQPTVQRLWTEQLQFEDREAGSFVFHEGHDHIHLDGFERYRLLDTQGQVVAEGGKVSFCLRDSLPVPALAPTAFTVSAGVECGDRAQAINVGSGDYYGPLLDDQWIDVTGVAPGNYVVEIVVDPDNLLDELNEENNRTVFPVTLIE